MDLTQALPVLLGIAWLLPLASFALIVFFGPRLGPHGRFAGHLATGAILGAFFIAVVALGGWLSHHPIGSGHAEEVASANSEANEAAQPDNEHLAEKAEYTGGWYSLVEIGTLSI